MQERCVTQLVVCARQQWPVLQALCWCLRSVYQVAPLFYQRHCFHETRFRAFRKVKTPRLPRITPYVLLAARSR